MSTLPPPPPEPPRLSLVLHTAVDFVPGQGIGIGIIQRAPMGAARNNIIPVDKRKHGVKRSQLTAQNVKTRARAHMLAILHAMGLARGTIKRWCTGTLKIHKVTVLCSLSTVVDMVNFHRGHRPESLKSVVKTNDRLMIKRVLTGIRHVSRRRRVEVAIAAEGQESSSREREKARKLARQRGTQACRSRRLAKRIALLAAETAENQTGSNAT